MRFLFVDRIVQSIPGELIRGVKHITPDDGYLFTDHAGRGCFFSSLIGETLGQLAAWNVMAHCNFTHRPVAGVVSRAYLHRPAYVGETLLLESFIDVVDETAVQYHSRATVGEEVVFTIESALGPMLPMGELIDESVARQQYAEIDRPGDWHSICERSRLPSTTVQNDVRCQPRISMQFDRILEEAPGVSIIAEKRVTRSAPYFPDHFPNKPVLPMTVLLECKLNLAFEFLSRAGLEGAYHVSEMRKIKMNEFVFPGDILICTLTVKQQTQSECILSFRSEVDGKRVCVLEMILTAKGN